MFINRKNQYFNIFILPNLINIFNRTLIKILASYFVENHKLDTEVYMEWQKIQNNQHNTEEKSWRTDTT